MHFLLHVDSFSPVDPLKKARMELAFVFLIASFFGLVFKEQAGFPL